jgi:hypothetical protein
MQPEEFVFQHAKRIVLNQDLPREEFRLLAKAIKEEWHSNLVNGDVYKYIQLTNPIRLRLILSTIEDLQLLPKLRNQRQELIGGLFRAIVEKLAHRPYLEYELSTLEVDYFSFEELAFQECVNSIDTGLIRAAFPESKIWSIQRFWNYYTVFFATNEDVKRNERNGISQKISLKFQEAAQAHDLFSVLRNRMITVRFDSKENFDNAGGGYYYYR